LPLINFFRTDRSRIEALRPEVGRAAAADEPGLLRLGPGGDFVTDYRPDRRGRLVAEAQAQRHGAEDRADSVQLSELALRAGTLLAAERVLEDQGRAMALAADLSRALAGPGMAAAPGSARVGLPVVVRSPGVPAGAGLRGESRSSALSAAAVSAGPAQPSMLEGQVYESHAQATSHPAVDPRLPRSPWLFADYAGTRRRDRRQQGHGVRARRGAHQEGRAHPRPQQGALFVDQ
jgi:hypothetical protein